MLTHGGSAIILNRDCEGADPTLEVATIEIAGRQLSKSRRFQGSLNVQFVIHDVAHKLHLRLRLIDALATPTLVETFLSPDGAVTGREGRCVRL
jgi:hypothetical protein